MGSRHPLLPQLTPATALRRQGTGIPYAASPSPCLLPPEALGIKARFPGTGSDLIHGLHLSCTFEVINYGDWKCYVGISTEWAVSAPSEPCSLQSLDIFKKDTASSLAGNDWVSA